MTTGKSDGDGKHRQPTQGVPKQVKFVMNLDSDSDCIQRTTLGDISEKAKFGHGDGSKVQSSAGEMDIKDVCSLKDALVRSDGKGLNFRAEMCQQQQERQKEFRAGLMGDGQELSDEDESRNNEVVDDAMDGDWHLANANTRPQGPSLSQQQQQPQGPSLSQQQQQPQGPVIRWERFLAQRCLRVLLVENDDSTRQVVSALLRNCSYEVTACANGLQAWKLLEDPSNHFDLVLTEVVMPSLSGIGLLCKIMSHQICKNIPVIMMSSHDSMGIVFKCLSKGAVDFLVKPVRKNELKNLWQHVWRRCQSSSGSGSETGSQTKRVVTPISEAEPDNNIGSNDESDDASIGLNIRDGSDNGSGTQSSWTKRTVEVESPRHRSEWDFGRSYCSTIAQVIQPKIATAQKEWMPLAGTSRECQDEKPFDYAMGQDLEIAVLGQAEVQVEHERDDKALCDQACAREETAGLASTAECAEIQEAIGTDDSPGESDNKAADLIGTIASKPESRNLELEDNGRREGLEKGVNTQMKDKTVADFKHLPFLELTLKRSRPNGEEEVEPEDRHVLRQSGCSAFSRYNTGGTHVSHPSGDSLQPNSSSKGFGGHCCITSGSLETGNHGSVRAAVPIERAGSSKGSGGDGSMPTPVQLSQSSNNQDLGSSVVGPSGQDMFPRPMPSKDDMGSATNAGPHVGKPKSMHPGVMSYDSVPGAYGSSVHPIYYSRTGPPLWGSEAQHANERDDTCNDSTPTEQQLLCPRVHHHHHHVQHVHHHHHHHQNQYKHSHEHSNKNERTMNNVSMTAPLCGSSNMVGSAPDCNNGESGSNNGYGSNGNGNGSVNGSASGSNNGSNGQNGQSSAALTPGTNGESDTGIALKSSTGGASGSGSGVDQNRSAQREAALTKFRQKRKERCFEKKVRYQSRKRLAEQRPRVRGQFVRQTVYEPTSGEAD